VGVFPESDWSLLSQQGVVFHFKFNGGQTLLLLQQRSSLISQHQKANSLGRQYLHILQLKIMLKKSKTVYSIAW
jgi:hypothetical protein